jgi:hypothetical protein
MDMQLKDGRPPIIFCLMDVDKLLSMGDNNSIMSFILISMLVQVWFPKPISIFFPFLQK